VHQKTTRGSRCLASTAQQPCVGFVCTQSLLKLARQAGIAALFCLQLAIFNLLGGNSYQNYVKNEKILYKIFTKKQFALDSPNLLCYNKSVSSFLDKSKQQSKGDHYEKQSIVTISCVAYCRLLCVYSLW
jgi:hypothetical protein